MANNDSLIIYEYPSLGEQYSNLPVFLVLGMLVAALLLLTNIYIFYTTALGLRQHLTVNKPLLWRSLVLTSLYAIISCAAFITVMVPQSWLICHTIMHLSFTVGAVLFRGVLFLYAGSEKRFLVEHPTQSITVNTPPCCCCCSFLPTCEPKNSIFYTTRCMIWQMPFVQGIIMLIINLIYYRKPEFYEDMLLYFAPFVVCSILLGIWALNITVRLVSTVVTDHRLMRKLFSLQLILLLCKLQYLILDNQLGNWIPDTVLLIDGRIFKQLIINILILCEMVLVSLLAKDAYKAPLPSKEPEAQFDSYM